MCAVLHSAEVKCRMDVYDIAVVGGGITGTGIARDAALRGLRTVLFEARDLAWGASSRSSKLIHGGIRYLETGDLRLVREACLERWRLLQLAPHVVQRIPFLIPIYEGDPRGILLLWLGTFLYDLLAGHHGIGRSKRLSKAELLEREPGINPDGLRGGVLYWDAQMDDALLNVLVAQGAAEAGASVQTYTPVVGTILSEGQVRGLLVKPPGASEPVEIHAKAVVNATGPWSDTVAGLVDGGIEAPPVRLRRTKGVHLGVRSRTREHALLLMSRRDKRIFFVIPYRGVSLVGTTDTDFEGDPAEAHVGPEDVEYLLTESGKAFREPIQAEEILSRFAGVRPLLAADADNPSQVSREHKIVIAPSGMVSAVGGKYTTFRAMAEETVDRVVRQFGFERAGPCLTREKPLPGGETSPEATGLDGLDADCAGLTPELRLHLTSRYGSRARDVAAFVSELGPEGLEPLAPDRPDIAAEVVYAKRRLWARTADDFLRRRSTLELVGAVTPGVRDRVDTLLDLA